MSFGISAIALTCLLVTNYSNCQVPRASREDKLSSSDANDDLADPRARRDVITPPSDKPTTRPPTKQEKEAAKRDKVIKHLDKVADFELKTLPKRKVKEKQNEKTNSTAKKENGVKKPKKVRRRRSALPNLFDTQEVQEKRESEGSKTNSKREDKNQGHPESVEDARNKRYTYVRKGNSDVTYYKKGDLANQKNPVLVKKDAGDVTMIRRSRREAIQDPGQLLDRLAEKQSRERSKSVAASSGVSHNSVNLKKSLNVATKANVASMNEDAPTADLFNQPGHDLTFVRKGGSDVTLLNKSPTDSGFNTYVRKRLRHVTLLKRPTRQVSREDDVGKPLTLIKKDGNSVIFLKKGEANDANAKTLLRKGADHVTLLKRAKRETPAQARSGGDQPMTLVKKQGGQITMLKHDKNDQRTLVKKKSDDVTMLRRTKRASDVAQGRTLSATPRLHNTVNRKRRYIPYKVQRQLRAEERAKDEKNVKNKPARKEAPKRKPAPTQSHKPVEEPDVVEEPNAEPEPQHKEAQQQTPTASRGNDGAETSQNVRREPNAQDVGPTAVQPQTPVRSPPPRRMQIMTQRFRQREPWQNRRPPPRPQQQPPQSQSPTPRRRWRRPPPQFAAQPRFRPYPPRGMYRRFPPVGYRPPPFQGFRGPPPPPPPGYQGYGRPGFRMRPQMQAFSGQGNAPNRG